MPTNAIDLSQNVINDHKRIVNRGVRTLMQEMEHENTLVPETALAKLQKVLRIYRGAKPLFAVFATLPLIPSSWRAVVTMLGQALDALAGAGDEISAQFKAGKDV